MKPELSAQHKADFRKTGASYKLRRRHCEGEVIPTENGTWHWWVRTPEGRQTGEEPYLSSACSRVSTAAAVWEHRIPADEPPLPTAPPRKE